MVYDVTGLINETGKNTLLLNKNAKTPAVYPSVLLYMYNTTASNTIKEIYLINGAETPECRVKEHLRRFNDSHLEYVFDCLQNNCSDIRNIRSYLLTTIYNAVDTISNYYDSRVRHDWA